MTYEKILERFRRKGLDVLTADDRAWLRYRLADKMKCGQALNVNEQEAWNALADAVHAEYLASMTRGKSLVES